MKKNVVIGFLGTQLDMGKKRRWRPSIQICEHPDFPVERFELLYGEDHLRLANSVKNTIEHLSPQTEVLLQRVDLKDPWDFEEMYGALYDFAQNYEFDEERENYHVHITTGTHVAQICWFLLTESRHFPANLLQSGPPREGSAPYGTKQIVDLDLSKFNALQQRFDRVTKEYNTLLKGGIETRNPEFNELIERMELVASSSDAPLLLHGPTVP